MTSRHTHHISLQDLSALSLPQRSSILQSYAGTRAAVPSIDLSRLRLPIQFELFRLGAAKINNYLQPLPNHFGYEREISMAANLPQIAMERDIASRELGPDRITSVATSLVNLASSQPVRTGNAIAKRNESPLGDMWMVRYRELCEYIKENGHPSVPHCYPKNPQLARWVKRQRRQFKLMKKNLTSAMTPERCQMLDDIGFVWDSHKDHWQEKFAALEAFRQQNGHCNVSLNNADKRLATWVKCQRRQYKIYKTGQPCGMTAERVRMLEHIGFLWEVRGSSAPAAPPAPAAPKAETTVAVSGLVKIPKQRTADYLYLRESGFIIK